jgi:hypothetical protein
MRRNIISNIFFTASLAFFMVAATPFAKQSSAAPSGLDATGMTTAVQPEASSSVLERFRTYTGPRTPEDLSALFTPSATGKVRQQPLIALSDGRTALILAIKVAADDNMAPGFSLVGCKQVSLQHKQNDEWLLNAIPDKGTWLASLMVVNNSGTFEYPLTVAPQVPPETDLSNEGFAAYLDAGQAGADAKLQDLNQDGKHDYVDDYIFTANYLVKQATTGNSREARRQRALQRTLSAPTSPPQPVSPKKDYDGVFYGEP